MKKTVISDSNGSSQRGHRPLAAQRNVRMDWIRILLAVAVIVGHAPELTDGNPSRDLLHRFTGTDVSLGGFAVLGFFLLSGALIVRSWESDPDFLNFLRKRILRIVPGYVVSFVLSVVIVGWLAPGTQHYFRELSFRHLVTNILTLNYPYTPPVLPGLKYGLVNGAMWTIGYEFRCYVMVALFGKLGLLRRRWVWLASTVVFAILALVLGPINPSGGAWRAVYVIFGEPHNIFRLMGTFFVGGCFYLYRDTIRFHWPLGVAAAIGLLGGLLNNHTVSAAITVCGGYLLFYFTQAPRKINVQPHAFPDISYGVYLYGWPIESLWIYFVRGSPWVTAFVATIMAAGMGWLSWHFVERPMLRLKRRPTSILPPA